MAAVDIIGRDLNKKGHELSSSSALIWATNLLRNSQLDRGRRRQVGAKSTWRLTGGAGCDAVATSSEGGKAGSEWLNFVWQPWSGTASAPYLDPSLYLCSAPTAAVGLVTVTGSRPRHNKISSSTSGSTSSQPLRSNTPSTSFLWPRTSPAESSPSATTMVSERWRYGDKHTDLGVSNFSERKLSVVSSHFFLRP